MQLVINQLSKSFGSKLIYHDVSFTFETGVYAIMGKNGVGKSVLMEMLAGVLPQDGGSIHLSNEGHNSSLSYKKKLVYIPEAPTFFPGATGDIFLKFIQSIKLNQQNLTGMNTLIDGFGLRPHLYTRFSDMSLGTQKKLFLTTLLIGESKLIIMDEPTNALDETSIAFLVQVISNLSKCAIVIIATHDQGFLEKISPTIIKLDTLPTRKL